MTPENIELLFTQGELSDLRQAAKRYLTAEATLRDALQRSAHYSDPRTVGFDLEKAARFTAEAADAFARAQLARELLSAKL